MRFFVLILTIAISISSSQALSASSKVVRLTTFEAPPFMSETLPEQGAAIYALRQMLKKVGYRLDISFAPFLRARSLSLQKNDLSGFFPVTTVNMTSDFVLSNTIYSSNWVFAQRKNKPITWNKPEDLTAYKIGNVKGYDLTEMMSLVDKQKGLKIDESPSDELNLLKLTNSRTDLALVDATMFEYLMKSSAKLRPFESRLQLNSKVVHLDEYGIAFKKTPLAQEHKQLFNTHVSRDEFARLVDVYFKTFLGDGVRETPALADK